MRHLHSLIFGQKTILTKATGYFEMPTILHYRIHILNFSKNRRFTAYRWNGIVSMMPNISKTERHLKQPSNLACLIPL
jgi:hypothetical protein